MVGKRLAVYDTVGEAGERLKLSQTLQISESKN